MHGCVLWMYMIMASWKIMVGVNDSMATTHRMCAKHMLLSRPFHHRVQISEVLYTMSTLQNLICFDGLCVGCIDGAPPTVLMQRVGVCADANC